MQDLQPEITRALKNKVRIFYKQTSFVINEAISFEIITNFTEFNHLPELLWPSVRYINFGQLPCACLCVHQFVILEVCVWLCVS